jgi:hypothetical protein
MKNQGAPMTHGRRGAPSMATRTMGRYRFRNPADPDSGASTSIDDE